MTGLFEPNDRHLPILPILSYLYCTYLATVVSSSVVVERSRVEGFNFG